MAATLVSDAALVAAEERHASADEQDETMQRVRAGYEQELSAVKQPVVLVATSSSVWLATGPPQSL